MKAIVVHKNSFKKSSKDYFIKNLKFFDVYFIDLLIGCLIIKQIHITNLGIWFLVFTIFTVINALFVLLIFKLMKETKFINRFKILFKKAS